MGMYINPPDTTKEEFLREHGQRASRRQIEAFSYSATTGVLPVCLISNWEFTAAGILYNERERTRCLTELGNRSHCFFFVPVQYLKPYMK